MMILVSNQTADGAEVQMTRNQMDALTKALIGSRNVALTQKLTTLYNRLANDLPVRVPFTTAEIEALREVADSLPEV